MREIKFRFWHLADKKMIDWVWITQNAWNSFRGDTPISLLFDFLTVKKDQVVIQQFTGLKDKNGNEIYEGDIVKHFDHAEIIREVIFMKGSFGYWTDDEFISYASNYHFEWKDLNKSENIEVIGSVHENPELLDPR